MKTQKAFKALAGLGRLLGESWKDQEDFRSKTVTNTSGALNDPLDV